MSVWFRCQEHGAAIAHAAGTGFDPIVDQVISRVTASRNLAGGFIYTNYTKVAISMHMAGFVPGWCTAQLLAFAFDYPFNQLKVERVFGTVPSTNHAALDQDMRGGWKEVTRILGAVEGGDMIVLSMSRHECKWLRLVPRYIRLKPCERGIAA
jgi:hypothetical protein